MTDDSRQLDEVVVIGYGTASKKDVTGAVSSVKATQLENENPQNVTDIPLRIKLTTENKLD